MEVIGGNHSIAFAIQRLIDEMNAEDPHLIQILKDLSENPYTGVTLELSKVYPKWCKKG